MGHVDGLFDFGGGALRDVPLNLPAGRVVHVNGLITAAQAHLPANKVTHGFHVTPSFQVRCRPAFAGGAALIVPLAKPRRQAG